MQAAPARSRLPPADLGHVLAPGLKRFRVFLVLIAGGSLLAGCGGEARTGPAAPAPPPPETISAPPGDLTVTPEKRTPEGNLYDLQWTAPAGATVTSFVIDVGSFPGASDVLTAETAGDVTSFPLTTQHRGQIWTRARARNSAGLSAPSNEVIAADLRDVIEALFFSTGELTPTHQPICQFTQSFPDIVEGFLPGTTLDVLISTSLSEPHMLAVNQLLDDMTSATGGTLQTVRELSEDRDYMEAAFRQNEFRRANELIILDVEDGQAFCGALGCGGGRLASGASTPLFRNAFAVVQEDAPSGVVAHELAHALGLCHVPANIAGVAALMGNIGVDHLSAAELAAVRSLYGAGLGPGATRQDLISAGLIGG